MPTHRPRRSKQEGVSDQPHHKLSNCARQSYPLEYPSDAGERLPPLLWKEGQQGHASATMLWNQLIYRSDWAWFLSVSGRTGKLFHPA